MDCAAIDRAMSRACIRATGPNLHGAFWIADNEAETLTDDPRRAKTWNRLADAWDAADRFRAEPGFAGLSFDALSVADLYAREEQA